MKFLVCLIVLCLLSVNCTTTVKSSLVRLQAEARSEVEGEVRVSTFYGSGFFVSNNGLLITAAHTLRGTHKEHVYLSDAPTKERGVSIVAVDIEADMALLKVRGVHTPSMRFCSMDEFIPRAEVIVFAWRFHRMERTAGWYMKLSPVEGRWYIRAVVAPGFSGGAVYSPGGRCVMGVVLKTNMDMSSPIGLFSRPEYSGTVMSALCELAPQAHKLCN